MTAINSNRAIRGPVTAVPVVPGKGVRLVADTLNNRWVVEADETVLYEDTNGGATGNISLSESVGNFETIKIIWSPSNAEGSPSQFNYGKLVALMDGANMLASQRFTLSGSMPDGNNSGTLVMRQRAFTIDATGKELTSILSFQVYYNGSSWTKSNNTTYVYKVVGVNRIASN